MSVPALGMHQSDPSSEARHISIPLQPREPVDVMTPVFVRIECRCHLLHTTVFIALLDQEIEIDGG